MREITYEMYRYIFMGGLIASGVFFAISVLLFFVLKIPSVISDLTGRTARKAIENIRRQNEQSGNKTYRSSTVNMQRGKLTDKISPSGRLVTRDENAFGVGSITQKIATHKLQTPGTDVLDCAPETDVLSGAAETDVLSYGAETDVLSGGETSLLSAGMGETSLLMPERGSTQELDQIQIPDMADARNDLAGLEPDPMFAVEYEITFIHTNEVIAQEA